MGRPAGGTAPRRGIALGAANEDEKAVLRTFFRDGRLTEIPRKASKRRIFLERIAIEFDPGVRYDEREVNAIVGASSTTTPRSVGTSSTRGSSIETPACTGAQAAASTYRRAARSRVVSVRSRRAGPSHRRFVTFRTR